MMVHRSDVLKALVCAAVRWFGLMMVWVDFLLWHAVQVVL